MTRHEAAIESLKDGVCPICHSRKIFSGAIVADKEGLRGSNRIPISATQSVALDNYVCVACGYTESYIANRAVLNRIQQTWKRVRPHART